MGAAAAALAWSLRCRRAAAHTDLSGGAAPRPHHRPLRHRRANKRHQLSRLYRAVPVPTLGPGDVVVMDNLGSHKSKAVRRLIRAAGAKLFFLPRYSPDLNPIEQVFAKLKTLLRKIDPRTIETTWRGIGDLLNRFTPQQCFNLIGSCSR